MVSENCSFLNYVAFPFSDTDSVDKEYIYFSHIIKDFRPGYASLKVFMNNKYTQEIIDNYNNILGIELSLDDLKFYLLFNIKNGQERAKIVTLCVIIREYDELIYNGPVYKIYERESKASELNNYVKQKFIEYNKLISLADDYCELGSNRNQFVEYHNYYL